MDEMDGLIAKASEIEEKIGYRFKDKGLLLSSFIHCSYFNENRETVGSHNERLEFLGDTVLGLIISEFIYSQYPHTPEGELSFYRSRLVDATACAGYVKEWGIGEYILLGKGERQNDGRGRDTIMADLFEALVGAVYLDGGLEAAKRVVLGNFRELIVDIIEAPDSNWKAKLQDWAQKRYHEPPKYEIEGEVGPDHDKQFEVSVWVRGEKRGVGRGNSKKEAQQEAAKKALEWVDEQS
jgi:ribonuclease-3